MKLPVLTFDYTKADGSSKQRKLLSLSHPSDLYFGVEFDNPTEISNVLEYLTEKKAVEDYLKAKYKIDQVKFKSFKSTRISNLSEDQLTVG
jgi:hypothetical protein